MQITALDEPAVGGEECGRRRPAAVVGGEYDRAVVARGLAETPDLCVELTQRGETTGGDLLFFGGFQRGLCGWITESPTEVVEAIIQHPRRHEEIPRLGFHQSQRGVRL